MDNELLFRIIGEAPLIAFLLYAWNSDRRERIDAQKKTIEVLERDRSESVKSA